MIKPLDTWELKWLHTTSYAAKWGTNGIIRKPFDFLVEISSLPRQSGPVIKLSFSKSLKNA